MQEEILYENIAEIMENAVNKAGELLTNKPHIAEIILKQLLKCDPEHLAGLQLLGLCKHRMGENAEAVEIIQTALDLDPTNADNWNNLGLAYGGLGYYEKAVQAIQKAIELNPEQFLFKNNLALQYRSLGNYDDAIKTMMDAIENKDEPHLWLNLGGIYGELKDIDNAQRCFENAIRLDPKYPAAYVDLAFAYHLKGDWKNGFAAYEWRFLYYPQMRFYHHAYDMKKIWDGKADLNGKRVLIYGEQGLGDIIQFSRYAKYLKQLGAYVIIHCPPSLDKIIRRLEGVDETTNRDIVNNRGEEFPEYDYQFSMMSFPYLLDIHEIEGKPYIQPITAKFKDHIKSNYPDTLNVGVIWAGSPSHPHDRKRSIPLKYFRAVHDVPGVKLFSLQLESAKRQYGVTFRNMELEVTKVDDPCLEKFHPDKEIVDYNADAEGMSIVDLTNMIQSFEDTATILAGLDMVICCDTATAHLAGAMGVPVWVAIPYNPDWRWKLEGDTTQWYDSMRLYRQTERDNWETVFERIGKDLSEVVLQNQRQGV